MVLISLALVLQDKERLTQQELLVAKAQQEGGLLVAKAQQEEEAQKAGGEDAEEE